MARTKAPSGPGLSDVYTRRRMLQEPNERSGGSQRYTRQPAQLQGMVSQAHGRGGAMLSAAQVIPCAEASIRTR
eukprot:3675748-Prymnesium_polylepis.1